MEEKLKGLLAGIPHVVSSRQRQEHYHRAYQFRLELSYVADLFIRSRWFDMEPEQFVLSLDVEQRAAFMEAMIDAEGHTSDNFTRIAQIDGPIQDAITLGVYLEGYRPTFSANSAEKNGYKPAGCVGMARPHVAPSQFDDHEVMENQTVWCVKTELETWTMRQGRRIMLTGNTIPGTFMAYHQPGTSFNITDPLANIAAAINYIASRYGSPYNLPSGGYASGGEFIARSPYLAMFGEGSSAERVTVERLDGRGYQKGRGDIILNGDINIVAPNEATVGTLLRSLENDITREG